VAAFSGAHPFAQFVPLESQTKEDVVSQIGRSVTPLIWSWVAVRRKTVDPWQLAAFRRFPWPPF